MAIDFHRINDEQFEEMCRLLVLVENPKATAIEPLQGDEGIDSFEGVIDQDIERVWQFKYFRTGIGKNQQDQIRRSLVKAVKKHKPKRWTLITNADMSTDLCRWLKKQRKDFPEVEIDVIPATKVRTLLHRHQDIRKDYFDLADAKNDMILKAMGKQGLLSASKPKAALLNDMQTAVEVINDNSPDFKYVIEEMSEEGCSIRLEPRHEGALGKTMAMVGIDFSAEDKETAKARIEYEKSLKEGRPIVLDSKHFTVKEAVFAELFDGKYSALEIVPMVPFVETPLKMVAKSEGREAVLNYVQMKLVRRGQNEFEVSNAHDIQSSIVLSFIFRYDGTPSSVNFNMGDYEGKHPSQVIEGERFLNLVSHKGCEIELTDLRSGKSIGSVVVSSPSPELTDNRLRTYEDLVVIEEKVNPELVIRPSQEQSPDILVARALAKAAAGEFTVPNQVMTVETTPEQTPIFLEQVAKSGTKGMCLWGKSRETVELFGVPYTSRISFRAQGATTIDAHEDGTATVEIDGDLLVHHEEILPGVRLVDTEAE